MCVQSGCLSGQEAWCLYYKINFEGRQQDWGCGGGGVSGRELEDDLALRYSLCTRAALKHSCFLLVPMEQEKESDRLAQTQGSPG